MLKLHRNSEKNEHKFIVRSEVKDEENEWNG